MFHCRVVTAHVQALALSEVEPSHKVFTQTACKRLKKHIIMLQYNTNKQLSMFTQVTRILFCIRLLIMQGNLMVRLPLYN